MTFLETSLNGVLILGLEPKPDERGFFARMWSEEELASHGLDARITQASLSYNRCRGTLRGLHYRVAPHAESKIVRCIRGAIYDVVVDLRSESASCYQWFGVELTSDNRKSIYIPEGCAHGFQTLEDHTEVLYLMSQRYVPEAERGLRWDDRAIGITWPPVEVRIMSERDRNWPLLSRSTGFDTDENAPPAQVSARQSQEDQ
jgi:dTDP-4-dehydrorhamnose 3,5-epimerase